ncbi:conserved hypothetical protein, partial [Ricinus communis]
DRAVGADLVQSFGRVLDDVGELALAPPQVALRLAPPRRFRVQRLHFLLEPDEVDVDGLPGRQRCRHVGAGMVMRHADLTEHVRHVGGWEQGPGIRAEQRKIELARQLVPQPLQVQGRVVAAARAQQRHHLAERVHRHAAGAGFGHDAADLVLETRAVGPAVRHHARQRRFGVEPRDVARRRRGTPFRARQLVQAPAQRIRVRAGGDDDTPSPCPQCPLDKGRHLVEQRLAVVVETHEMPRLSVFAGQQVVGLDQHGSLVGGRSGGAVLPVVTLTSRIETCQR